MSKEARCPYCLDALIGEEPVVRCVLCRTPHHEVCFNENAGCVAFGCGSVVAGAAGQSVLLRRAPLELGLPWKETPLSPLEGAVARYRPAKRLEAERAGRPPPHASVRFSVDRAALYPGQDLRARIVVAVPEATAVRRLEVHVYEEPRGGSVLPRRLFRATILGRPPLSLTRLLRSVGSLTRRAPRLEPGLHPFDVEIPGFYGRVILAGTTVQTTVGVVLERSDRPALYSPHVEITPAWATAFANQGQANIARPQVRDFPRPEPDARGNTIVDDARALPVVRPVRGPTPAPPVLSPDGRAALYEDSEFSDAPSRLWGDARNPAAGAAWPQMGRSDADPLREVARALRLAPQPASPLEDPDALIGPPRAERAPAPAPATPAPAMPLSAAPDDANPRRIVLRRRDPGDRGPLEATPSGRMPSASEASAAVSALPPPAPAGAPRTSGRLTVPFAEGSAAGPPTGRSAGVRLEPRRELAPLRLSLEVTAVPSALDPTGPIELLVDAPAPLRSLELGCRYELSAESSGDAALGRFPRMETAVLVGEGGLSPDGTGHEDVLRASIELSPALVDEARVLCEIARLRSAELVLRFAVDGTAWDGSLVGSGTRVVRIPLAKPGHEDKSDTSV